jgi:hypothetical protein
MKNEKIYIMVDLLNAEYERLNRIYEAHADKTKVLPHGEVMELLGKIRGTLNAKAIARRIRDDDWPEPIPEALLNEIAEGVKSLDAIVAGGAPQ